MLYPYNGTSSSNKKDKLWITHIRVHSESFHFYETQGKTNLTYNSKKKKKKADQCLPCVKNWGGGFPGGAVVESLPANAGDTGLSPGLGRSHMPRSD